MICPRCKQDRVHRSHRAGIADWAASLAGRRPYRCHACNERFLVRRDGGASSRRSDVEREIVRTRRGIRWQKVKNELIVYGVGVLAFLGILYFLLQEKGP
jgi:transposase-like protein